MINNFLCLCDNRLFYRLGLGFVNLGRIDRTFAMFGMVKCVHCEVRNENGSSNLPFCDYYRCLQQLTAGGRQFGEYTDTYKYGHETRNPSYQSETREMCIEWARENGFLVEKLVSF